MHLSNFCSGLKIPSW